MKNWLAGGGTGDRFAITTDSEGAFMASAATGDGLSCLLTAPLPINSVTGSLGACTMDVPRNKCWGTEA